MARGSTTESAFAAQLVTKCGLVVDSSNTPEQLTVARRYMDRAFTIMDDDQYPFSRWQQDRMIRIQSGLKCKETLYI